MKLMLASFDTSGMKDWDIAKHSKYVLCSFFYLRKTMKTKELKELVITRNTTRDFLLDSGAFTLFSGENKNVNFDKYLEKYIQFINKYDIHQFIELDIDVIVGHEKVLEYRKILEKETGKKCIPVWHKSRGIEAYKQIVRDYDYICIGGLGNKEIKSVEYNNVKKLVRYANFHNTNVHGLAFTRKNSHDYGFYSVDSSSWTTGQRFGSLHIFTGESLKITSKPKGKKGNGYKLQRNNLKNWIQYQHYIDKMGVNKK